MEGDENRWRASTCWDLHRTGVWDCIAPVDLVEAAREASEIGFDVVGGVRVQL